MLEKKKFLMTEIEIKLTLPESDYGKVIDYAICLGVTNAFIQEGETAKESFIPDFDDFGFLNEIRAKRS